MLDISATFIRNSIRSEHSVQYLLPPTVVDYIKIKKFYK
jgi:nicotinate-nucleotide adenylyltransferase